MQPPLRSELALLDTLFRSAPIGLAFLDRELRFVRVNSVLAELNGLTPEAHVGKRPSELYPDLPASPDMRAVEDDLRRVLATRRPQLDVSLSGETAAEPGRMRFWLNSWYPVVVEGEVVGIGAVVREVTAQREAEGAVRRQADLLALSHDAILVWGLDRGGIETWNRGAVELYGFEEAEARGHTARDFLQTTFPVRWSDVESILRRDRRWDGELSHRTRDGRRVTVSARLQLVRGDDGVERVLEVNRDVTASKAAERRLAYLASFPEQSPHPILELELSGDRCVRYANPAVRRLIPELREGLPIPPQLASWESSARRSLDARASSDGPVVTLRDSSYQLSFSHVPEEGVVRIFALDVTERISAEAALRDSETRFRTVTENAPDTIARFDREQRHLFVNRAVVRATGISAEAYLGKTKRELGMPSEHVALWEENVRRVFDTGAPCNFDFSLSGAQGVAFYEARLVPELARNGGVGSVLAISRDVTDARRAGQELVRARGEAERRAGEAEDAERALRASHEQLRALVARVNSIREEEKARIARDLHDHAGQILTALKLQLESLEDGLGELPTAGAIPALLDHAVAASELVTTVIESVHHLVAFLRPVALDRLGLVAALRQECRSFQQWGGVACEVVADEVLVTFGPDIDTALFRIAQEALTNVARHARASRVAVSLGAPPGSVVLRIVDDGCGIRDGGVDGLGLLGMRERAERLGGELVVEPGAGGGTVVAVRIPVGAGVVRG